MIKPLWGFGSPWVVICTKIYQNCCQVTCSSSNQIKMFTFDISRDFDHCSVKLSEVQALRWPMIYLLHVCRQWFALAPTCNATAFTINCRTMMAWKRYYNITPCITVLYILSNNCCFGASILHFFGGLCLRIPLSLKAMHKLLDRTLRQTYVSKHDPWQG